ncbi:rhomboid family-domain-containing protein [Thamnocephalis sphaerospora]|uniref:Rhomboid-type serine protease n=1 Tax=Thamnocephalis sphaerospora TaxID=78915 RepID=A0A4P9XN04_9FUNG|nr:rhomboid family-domain-containing protein [Thamnocephalis sphaerospora]|eukprot:RKP06771.1 rhomboid family-domain-containing protein [Thamnocephalis sphaerospora]
MAAQTKARGVLRDADGQFRPLFMYTIMVLQLVALVVEFCLNYQLTGSVIATSPQFNYMIGPAPYTWVQVGARYTPCIRPTKLSQQPSQLISIAGASSPLTLSELCGFGGFEAGHPNQWYRLILPMFLHGGIIHLLFNMAFQWRNGLQMERDWGAHRVAPIYLLGGMGGFLLGATLAPPSMVSMGASGALFALMAACIVELLQHWGETAGRGRMLAELIGMVVISLVLGLLPGIDNFSHIGGFLFGLLLALACLPAVPGRFWTLMRWGSAAVLIAVFAILFSVFYAADDPTTICPGCRYLSCLPINGWCDI